LVGQSLDILLVSQRTLICKLLALNIREHLVYLARKFIFEEIYRTDDVRVSYQRSKFELILVRKLFLFVVISGYLHSVWLLSVHVRYFIALVDLRVHTFADLFTLCVARFKLGFCQLRMSPQ
jgi:hypothetical protein